MSECFLSSSEICAGAQSVERCVFRIRIVQLPVEEHGDSSGLVGVGWNIKGDYIFFTIFGPECNLCCWPNRPVCLYFGDAFPCNAVVRIRPPLHFWPKSGPFFFFEEEVLIWCSIDILASRIAGSSRRYELSSHTRNQGQKPPGLNTHSHQGRTEFEMYSNVKSQVYVGDDASSSQEHIVNAASSSNNEGSDGQSEGISKTVEFKVHESAV